MAIGKFSGVVFSDSSKVSSSESEYAYSISGTSQDFEMTISISDAAVSFLLPLEKLTDDGINGTIFWGDGSTDALSFGVVASHTYSATGTYKVRVVSSTGVGLDTVYGSNFDNPPTSIDAWGSSFNGMGFRTDLGNVTTVRKYPPVNFTNNFWNAPFWDWRSLDSDFTEYGPANLSPPPAGEYYFPFVFCDSFTGIGCENLIDSSATDIQGFFAICPLFNVDISGWDVSNVVVFQYMFQGCTSFNQDISSWDMSSAEECRAMFENCTSFDQDISSWVVSNVSNFREMFDGCTSFNQDLSSWDVTGTGNAASSATGLHGIFENCTSFDQDLSGWNVSFNKTFTSMFQNSGMTHNLNSWNTSSGILFSATFFNCPFDHSLENWNMSSAFSANNFLNNTTISLSNKAKTLVGIMGNNPAVGVSATAVLGTTVFDKSATIGVEGYDGQATYGAWLKATGTPDPTNRASGTNDSVVSNKLIDSSATFTATVVSGCFVENTTAGTFAEVTTVVSDTELDLSDDIFTVVSDAYSVDGGVGWAFSGTSFV